MEGAGTPGLPNAHLEGIKDVAEEHPRFVFGFGLYNSTMQHPTHNNNKAVLQDFRDVLSDF